MAEEIGQMQSAERSPERASSQTPAATRHSCRARSSRTSLPATECCGQPMKRIGEDVAEKLDYTPGVFTVHKHVRGKWVCACCQTLRQAPVEAHIIDKGIRPPPALLAHVLVAKYADHLPLYRQEAIYARAGVPIPRSTLGAVGRQLRRATAAAGRCFAPGGAAPHGHPRRRDTGADAQAREPKGRQDPRAYLWAYTPGRHEAIRAVVYDFCESRAGRHARAFLQGWSGTLLVDDFAGYKQLMTGSIEEAGCWAHARRKFFELHVANKSQIAEQALQQIGQLYDIERQVQDAHALRIAGVPASSKAALSSTNCMTG